jgi:hypothetical protein
LKGKDVRKIALPILCVSFLSFFASSLLAQQTLGSINGTVVDGSGAAVPGSTLTVTDAALNVTRTIHSQPNGSFQIFNLPPGTYQVQVTHDGFDTTQLVGIQVREAQATTVSAKLRSARSPPRSTLRPTPC